MTVSSTTSSVSYSGNGSTTLFSIPYKFIENDDIVATLRDAQGIGTVWVLNTDYTLAGAGGASGTLTATTAPASGETLIINRSTDLTQETDYIENDTFPADSHELALDKLTLQIQDTKNSVNTNTVRAADTVTDGPTLTFSEAAAERASKVIGFDTNGDVELQAGVGDWQGTWATSTAYAIRDVVIDGAAGANTTNIYICLEAHTSGTWATDLGNLYWDLMVDVEDATTAASAAAASAAAAASSETNAAASEASASADAASTAADAISTAADAASTAADAVSTAADAASTAADVVTVTALLGASGSDAVINLGDRTTGSAMFNYGNRV